MEGSLFRPPDRHASLRSRFRPRSFEVGDEDDVEVDGAAGGGEAAIAGPVEPEDEAVVEVGHLLGGPARDGLAPDVRDAVAIVYVGDGLAVRRPAEDHLAVLPYRGLREGRQQGFPTAA